MNCFKSKSYRSKDLARGNKVEKSFSFFKRIKEFKKTCVTSSGSAASNLPYDNSLEAQQVIDIVTVANKEQNEVGTDSGSSEIANQLQLQEFGTNAGLPASNLRCYNPPEAQPVLNPVTVVTRKQNEVELSDGDFDQFSAKLEHILVSWNLKWALAPVSPFCLERNCTKKFLANEKKSSTIRRHRIRHLKSLARLSIPVEYESNLNSNLPNEMLQSLPNEVLMHIFSFLDDISLYVVGNVCLRWHQVLVSQLTNEQWKIYSFLANSNCCLTCLREEFEEDAYSGTKLPKRRIPMESDSGSYEGIEIIPVGESLKYWRASITGPTDSPYEGGIFYLHIKMPSNYPSLPPKVYFVTRILHPNISRHGDIGVDTLAQNWSPSLVLPKLLISIQSLLTDPYTKICMEPEVGRMYDQNRKLFNLMARRCTRQFAMHDFITSRMP